MAPLLFAALAMASGRAAGDEVYLANGDRLSGEVVAKSGVSLVLRTPYAGDITLRWDDVVGLATRAPVEVMLAGAKAPLRARLEAGGSAGAVHLVSEAPGAVREVRLQDIEYLNPKPHETGYGTTYSGRTNLSAAHASGNSSSNRFYGDIELMARARDYRYGLSGKAERRTEAAQSNVAWLLKGNYDRLYGPRRFVYGRGSLEHDPARDIDRRSTAGVGYGVQVLDTPAAQLTLRGGVDYVVLDRLVAQGERYPALGWGLSATWSPFGPRLQFFHEQDGFWNLEHTRSVVVRSKTGLRVPLVERLNATAQLNLDWERTPAPGRVPTDRTLLLGIDYNF